MRLIGLAVCIAFGLILAPIVAGAQQAEKVARLGFLGLFTPEFAAVNVTAVREELSELGWREGQNINFEWRHASGRRDQLGLLAEELIQQKVDVIVAFGTDASFAAKRATSTVPVVMAGAADPVGTRLVASLARPGGNVTGVSLLMSTRAALRTGSLISLRQCGQLGVHMRYFASRTETRSERGVALGIPLRRRNDAKDQNSTSSSTVSPEASHPRAHARQFARRNILTPVTGLAGSAVVFFVSKVHVWAVPVVRFPRATAFWLPAFHHLAHQLTVVAVLLWNRQVPIRTGRSSHNKLCLTRPLGNALIIRLSC